MVSLVGAGHQPHYCGVASQEMVGEFEKPGWAAEHDQDYDLHCEWV
ncbi:MAG: hypothetical protein ABSD48_20765 [Armatimonadota bacterium]